MLTPRAQRAVAPLIGLLMLVTLTACGKHPYFGSEIPDPCHINEQETPVRARPEGAAPIPAPGQSITMFSVMLNVLQFDASGQACLVEEPIGLAWDVHLYATVDGVSVWHEQKTGKLLPADLRVQAPYQADFYLLKPANETSRVMFDFSAKHFPTGDLPEHGVIAGCLIKMDGATFAHVNTYPRMVGGDFLQCKIDDLPVV